MILGLVDKRVRASYYYNDMGIAFEHIVLKATDMGLGTCWMGMTRRSDEARELLGVPEELEVIIQTPLGYPAETPERRGRKTLEEIVSWEKFGKKTNTFLIKKMWGLEVVPQIQVPCSVCPGVHDYSDTVVLGTQKRVDTGPVACGVTPSMYDDTDGHRTLVVAPTVKAELVFQQYNVA